MAENSELQVLQGNNQFTNDFYKILAEQDGNVFFSPASIHLVLSMAYQGAQGITAQHFAQALKVPQANTAAEGYNAIMKRLNSVDKVTLLMANKVYVMSGFILSENFKTVITKDFLSNVQLVDFTQNQVAAKTINDWVKKQTRGKIQDLISNDALDGSSRLVLVNAIYFKGNWKYKFKESKTKTESFYLNEKDKIKVPMMHTVSSFYYDNDDNLGAQILELPYINEDLSMIIILPHKKNGINELEEKLSKANLTDVIRELGWSDVNVSLPRFKIETAIDLTDSLIKIGLGEIFQANANFKGMLENSDGNLYVSQVVQKAFIEINEEGSEAAAATGMIKQKKSASFWNRPRPVPKFIADHPFVFILSEKRNNHLFIGRLSNPKKLEI